MPYVRCTRPNCSKRGCAFVLANVDIYPSPDWSSDSDADLEGNCNDLTSNCFSPRNGNLSSHPSRYSKDYHSHRSHVALMVPMPMIGSQSPFLTAPPELDSWRRRTNLTEYMSSSCSAPSHKEYLPSASLVNGSYLRNGSLSNHQPNSSFHWEYAVHPTFLREPATGSNNSDASQGWEEGDSECSSECGCDQAVLEDNYMSSPSDGYFAASAFLRPTQLDACANGSHMQSNRMPSLLVPPSERARRKSVEQGSRAGSPCHSAPSAQPAAEQVPRSPDHRQDVWCFQSTLGNVHEKAANGERLATLLSRDINCFWFQPEVNTPTTSEQNLPPSEGDAPTFYGVPLSQPASSSGAESCLAPKSFIENGAPFLNMQRVHGNTSANILSGVMGNAICSASSVLTPGKHLDDQKRLSASNTQQSDLLGLYSSLLEADPEEDCDQWEYYHVAHDGSVPYGVTFAPTRRSVAKKGSSVSFSVMRKPREAVAPHLTRNNDLFLASVPRPSLPGGSADDAATPNSDTLSPFYRAFNSDGTRYNLW